MRLRGPRRPARPAAGPARAAARRAPRTPGPRLASRLDELAEPLRVAADQRGVLPRRRGVAVRDPPTDPEPAAGVIEDPVRDRADPGQGEAELVGGQPARRQLDGEDRSAI